MSRPATSRLKVNPILGLRPSLENCRIGDLNVDSAYQRSIDAGASQTLIRRIAMFWDWSLFHPLSVARRADGTLWVVDGQHRLAAARLRKDIYDIPCVVMSYASVEDEAASFVAMNVQRRQLSALDLFKAAHAANDSSALTIVRLLEGVGLSLAPHSNFTAWKPGMVSNIGGIQKCYNRYGEAKTALTLRILADAFPGQVLRYGGTIFAGLQHIVGKCGGLDPLLLTEVLAGASQVEWMDDIKLEKAAGGARWENAAEVAIAKAYREAVAEMEDAA